MQAGSRVESTSDRRRTRRVKARWAGCSQTVTLALAAALLSQAPAQAQDLESFAILAGLSVTNTGPTTITGNIGIYPGSSITGAGSITQTGAMYIADPGGVALNAQDQLTTLYDFLFNQPFDVDLTGTDLGALGGPLGPGVYNFDAEAGLTGNLTLDGQNNPDSIFIFNIGSELTTASGSSVSLINGAQGGNVFFRVGSSATLGTSTSFVGQIVALTSISLTTTASITCGAALARNGTVSLDTNVINICVLAGVIGDTLDDADVDEDSNARAVADALDAYIAAFGALPPGFAILALLSPEALAAALEQLAGEIGTGGALSSTQGANSFVSLAFGDRAGRGISVSPGDEGPQNDNTVRAMGYVEIATRPTHAAFSDLDSGTSRSWDIWLGGYGSLSFTGGDDVIGTHDRTVLDYGLAGGIDFLVRPGTQLGVALGWGGTRFSLSDDMGSGETDMLQAAIHARSEGDAAYLAAGAAYGFSSVTTERQVTIAGIDEFRSEYDAHTLTAEVEAGYRMEWLTPYAAVRGQAYFAPAYSESVVSGVGTFALNYEAQTMLSARTELGVRGEWTHELSGGAELSIHTSAAWAHDFRTGDTVQAYSQELGPVTTMTVQGATPAADLLLVGASATIGFDNGFAIGGSLDGEFSWNSMAYGGALTLSRTW